MTSMDRQVCPAGVPRRCAISACGFVSGYWVVAVWYQCLMGMRERRRQGPGGESLEL